MIHKVPGLFDFADRSFVDRVRHHAETIVAGRAAWHIPPADTLFVQRKVSGTALLAVRMLGIADPDLVSAMSVYQADLNAQAKAKKKAKPAKRK